MGVVERLGRVRRKAKQRQDKRHDPQHPAGDFFPAAALSLVDLKCDAGLHIPLVAPPAPPGTRVACAGVMRRKPVPFADRMEQAARTGFENGGEFRDYSQAFVTVRLLRGRFHLHAQEKKRTTPEKICHALSCKSPFSKPLIFSAHAVPLWCGPNRIIFRSAPANQCEQKQQTEKEPADICDRH